MRVSQVGGNVSGRVARTPTLPFSPTTSSALFVLGSLLCISCNILFGGGDDSHEIILIPANLLFIEQSGQDTGPATMIDMALGIPAELRATSFTLQYSIDIGSTWYDSLRSGNPLTT